MTKVTNLRQFRKRKARTLKSDKAAENRFKFGRTPAQRERDEKQIQHAQARLDQLRRDGDDSDKT